MKKTLFAMAALALCGTAFAREYYASDYDGKTFTYDDFERESEVVFHVNHPANLEAFEVWHAESVTLNFVGANTFLTSPYVDLQVPNLGTGTRAITGDEAAINHWVSELTSATGEFKSVTLVSSDGEFYAPASVSFEGLTESGSITLGDATLTYMGFHKVANAGEAEALITGDNQIALVFISSGNWSPGSLVLVGKATPATPEPATATLSLLALAGLATRRRRK